MVRARRLRVRQDPPSGKAARESLTRYIHVDQAIGIGWAWATTTRTLALAGSSDVTVMNFICMSLDRIS